MTREEAERLANEEIESCIENNEFIRKWIWDVYSSPELYDYNISEHRDKVHEVFTKHFLFRNTPLMKALEECEKVSKK